MPSTSGPSPGAGAASGWPTTTTTSSRRDPAVSLPGEPGDMRIELIAPEGLPIFEAGDDLAGLVVEALGRDGVTLADHDVVVVTAKAVSKAEGRAVALSSI